MYLLLWFLKLYLRNSLWKPQFTASILLSREKMKFATAPTVFLNRPFHPLRQVHFAVVGWMGLWSFFLGILSLPHLNHLQTDWSMECLDVLPYWILGYFGEISLPEYWSGDWGCLKAGKGLTCSTVSKRRNWWIPDLQGCRAEPELVSPAADRQRTGSREPWHCPMSIT